MPFPSLTQAVEAEGYVVQEVTDVPGVGGHGAKGVGAAGRKGVEAHEAHVSQERPRVGVTPEVQAVGEHQEPPQEIPATGGRGTVSCHAHTLSSIMRQPTSQEKKKPHTQN